MGGLSAAFLCRLYMVDPNPAYLSLARDFQRFSIQSTPRQFEFPQVCKSGWGAALLYQVTGEEQYAAWAVKLAHWFADTQADDGSWVFDRRPHGGPHVGTDGRVRGARRHDHRLPGKPSVKTTTSAVLVDVERFELREFPIPAIGDDDGLLRLELAGVCGSDVLHWRGNSAVSRNLPAILGHEIVGRIEQVGQNAARRWGVAAGDRVIVEASFGCGSCELCLRGSYQMCAAGQGYGGRISAQRHAPPLGRLRAAPLPAAASPRPPRRRSTFHPRSAS